MTSVLPRHVPATAADRARRPAGPPQRAVPVAAGSACLGLAMLVGLDGSLPWQIARVALVAGTRKWLSQLTPMDVHEALSVGPASPPWA